MTGLVVVVSGPGGVGKGTVVEAVVERDERLSLSRSWTTRDARPGEAPEAYVFATEEEFLARVEQNGFLEWNHFLGTAYYGTPMPDPQSTNDLVLEIDVNGARQIVDRGLQPILIFVDAPSPAHQHGRLVGRGDTAEQVERRMQAGEDERRLAKELPYAYVVNDHIDIAVDQILAIIDQRREDQTIELGSP